MKKLITILLSIMILFVISCSMQSRIASDIDSTFLIKIIDTTEIIYTPYYLDTLQTEKIVKSIKDIKGFRPIEKSIKSMEIDTSIKFEKQNQYKPLQKFK